MSSITVKINIAGRIYPLTIDKTEEERVKNVVNKIKDDLLSLENTYSVKDSKDLLAMLVFQYGNELVDCMNSPKISKESNQILDDLNHHLNLVLTTT